MTPLALKLGLDQSNLLPGRRNACHVVAEITAGELVQGVDRPAMEIVFVLDCSASMKGPPLEHVCRSVERVVDFLTPEDRVGIVTFSTTAHVEVMLQPATDSTKEEFRAVVGKLDAGAQTNMEGGLQLGAELLRAPSIRRKAMFLLSDGVPNIGLCTPLTLAERARRLRSDLSIWSMGYGPHHQEDILGAVSDAAGGRYQYIPEPEICEFMFAKALGVQGAIVAEAVELELVPHPSTKIIRFLGKLSVRTEGAVHVVSLPDFLAQTRRLVVAEVELEPSEEQGLWNAMAARLSYRIPGREGRSVHDKHFAPVMIASTSSQVVPEARIGVLLAQCDQVRDEARSLADRGQFDEAVEQLRTVRAELTDWPGFVEGDGSPLAVAAEVLGDEMMALEARPALEQYKAFRRSQMNVSLTGESLSASWQSIENAYGDDVVRAVAGAYPSATVEQVVGIEMGRVIRLHAEQTLGRSGAVDIAIASERVSRTHSVIAAQRGRFYVMDLGSANGTWVNEQRIQTHALRDGDIISLATDVAFRYSEAKQAKRMVAITETGDAHIIEPDRLFVIGRSRACSLSLNDEGVARRHAAIHSDQGRYFLEVYAGATPVVRAGRTLARVEVHDGDRIQIGGTTLVFELR